MNKKGVSPVIATLLLVVIAVAAAAVTYSFVLGFFGTYQAAQPSGSYISVDSAGAGSISVRNTGISTVAISAIYLDDGTLVWSGNAQVQPKSFGVVNFDASGIAGYHRLKVVCADGAIAWSETVNFG